jgi:hypothetical protein
LKFNLHRYILGLDFEKITGSRSSKSKVAVARAEEESSNAGGGEPISVARGSGDRTDRTAAASLASTSGGGPEPLMKREPADPSTAAPSMDLLMGAIDGTATAGVNEDLKSPKIPRKLAGGWGKVKAGTFADGLKVGGVQSFSSVDPWRLKPPGDPSLET